MKKKMYYLTMYTTGYDPGHHDFRWEEALPFWLSEIAAIVAHKAAGRTGINKLVSRATMGFLTL